MTTRVALLLLAAARAWGQSPFPAPGRMIDLGGHRLHLWCTGSGSPTVVVENGLGDFSFDWVLVRAQVEGFTRICTYDRGGYAWSDPGPMPRTFDQLNLELHEALRLAGERGPFLLVGHSFGGGVVRQYAMSYRREVVGLVLAEIVSEDQRIPMGPRTARIRDFATGRAIPKPRLEMTASDRGAKQDVAPPVPIEPPYDRLPSRDRQLHAWAASLPGLRTAEDSQRDWSSEYMARFAAKPQENVFGDLPLAVLTRSRGYEDVELEAERKRAQSQLARLSTRGVQTVVVAGHNLHLEAPEEVAKAIRGIVEQTR